METKPCNKCGTVLSLEEFPREKRNKDGRAGRCQPCRSKRDWRNKFSDAERTAPKQGPPDLTVLSLGAGVQSTTVLMMAAHGELAGLDAAIFADTGWEPQEVYDHLEWLKEKSENAGIPVHVVSAGSIYEDSLETEVSMPVFVDGTSGRGGMVRRQCTKRYKIDPIRKQILDLIGRDWHHNIVDQWMGISWDEIERISESQNSWLRFRYPLVDARMTRQDCLDWMREKGYPEPPRSACVGCPYRTDREWVRIKNSPHWDEAVEFDRRLRSETVALTNNAYLHRSRKPLDEVEFRPSDGPDTSGCGAYCFT